MEPTLTDLATGLPSDEGEVILPEHVMQTLMAEVGLQNDEADLRVPPIGALLRA
jgi:urease accessory protein UreE